MEKERPKISNFHTCLLLDTWLHVPSRFSKTTQFVLFQPSSRFNVVAAISIIFLHSSRRRSKGVQPTQTDVLTPGAVVV